MEQPSATGAPFAAPPGYPRSGPVGGPAVGPVGGPAPAVPKRSPLFVVAGVLALLGGLLSAGLPLLDQVLHVAVDNWAVAWGYDLDSRPSGPHIFLSNTVYFLSELAVAVVALVFCVRSGRSRFLGAGLLAGLGLADLGQGIYRLAYQDIAEPDHFFDRTWVYGLGNTVVALAAILAFVGILLSRPEVTVGRPVRLAWSLVLVGLGVVTMVVYLSLQFVDRNEFQAASVLRAVLAAVACLVLPAWAAFARPTPLAVGVIAGLLSRILPSVLDLTVWWNGYGGATRWIWVGYLFLGVAMLVVSILAFRPRRAPNGPYGTNTT